MAQRTIPTPPHQHDERPCVKISCGSCDAVICSTYAKQIKMCPKCGKRYWITWEEFLGEARPLTEDEPAGERLTKRPLPALACADCGKEGEMTGHQDCQYPQDHE